MPRSVKKGPYIQGHLMKKVQASLAANVNRPIKTWSRSSMILPEMVGLTFACHNGRDFVPFRVTDNMVGHKLGEFACTRNFRSHRAADKKAKGADEKK